MKLTGVVYGDPSCPNTVTCERTWSTDQGGKLRRIKRHRILSPAQADALGIVVPDDEFLVFTPDETDGSAT